MISSLLFLRKRNPFAYMSTSIPFTIYLTVRIRPWVLAVYGNKCKFTFSRRLTISIKHSYANVLLVGFLGFSQDVLTQPLPCSSIS